MGFRYYSDIDQSPVEPDINLTLAVSHAVSLRLSLNAHVQARYQVDPDLELEGTSNRRSGNYFYTRNTISASYQWLPRISTVSTYTLGTLLHEEELVAMVEDRIDHSLAQQLRYQLRPTTHLTSGYTFAVVDYSLDGRDSTSHSLLVGLDEVIAIGPRLSGGVHAGAQVRSISYEFVNEDEVNAAPYLNGRLSYTIGASTTVNWTAAYSLDEFDSFGGGGTTVRTGLRLTHKLTRTIGTNLSAFYRRYGGELDEVERDARRGSSEDAFDVSIGASCAIHRLLSANVGYQFTHASTDRERGCTRAIATLLA